MLLPFTCRRLMQPLFSRRDTCEHLVGESCHGTVVVFQLPKGSRRDREDGKHIRMLTLRLCRSVAIVMPVVSTGEVSAKAVHDASVAGLDSSMAKPIP
jgi:hypothetical protein